MAEHDHDDHFDKRYVGLVATVIGGVILLSGLIGLLMNLM